jgi:hypothetical protein
LQVVEAALALSEVRAPSEVLAEMAAQELLEPTESLPTVAMEAVVVLAAAAAAVVLAAVVLAGLRTAW